MAETTVDIDALDEENAPSSYTTETEESAPGRGQSITAPGSGLGRRKEAVARVRLVPGTGKVTVNGRDGKEYFGREALLDYAKTPFKVTDTQDHFDVLARIDGGGISGQAGALRHGISRALLAAGDYRAELKKAGFLTRDARMVERKKYGLKKARKRPQFSKR